MIYETFRISLHEKDRALLELIQAFFGVGKIFQLAKDSIQYRVSSTKDLKVIIDHFDKYPLITQKRADFELFKQIVEMLSRKEHHTKEGLQQIVNLRASINNGLSDDLKAAFPNITPVQRPQLTVSATCINPYWLSGFTTGEGSFLVNIFKTVDTKLGFAVSLRFQITQHIRDEQLIKSLV